MPVLGSRVIPTFREETKAVNVGAIVSRPSTMSVPKPIATMTAEDFMVWSERQPGDARYELLDGEIRAMASERVIHARTKNAVLRHLERGIVDKKLPCEAFGDGMAIRADDHTVFEPDALVRCGPRLGDDIVLVLDPIIVVEVGSPSTQRVDALTKLLHYFHNPTVMHYLIVLAAERMAIHHRRGSEAAIETTMHAGGPIVFDPPGLTIDLTDVFAALD